MAARKEEKSGGGGGGGGGGGLERTITTIDTCFLFRVPVSSVSSMGHKASVWNSNPIWNGRVRVVVRGGNTCHVVFENASDGTMYVECLYSHPRIVEAAVDSSRYFVLRVEDGRGHHALLGLGFRQRDEAFDFKVALQDFESQTTGVDKAKAAFEEMPTRDFSLADGQRITVNFTTKKKKKDDDDDDDDDDGGGKKKKKKKSGGVKPVVVASGSGGFALAPPPSKSKGSRRKRGGGEPEAQEKGGGAAQKSPAAAAAGGGGGGQADLLGLESDFSGLPLPSSSSSSSTASPKKDKKDKKKKKKKKAKAEDNPWKDAGDDGDDAAWAQF